jgi:hypothetical protein
MGCVANIDGIPLLGKCCPQRELCEGNNITLLSHYRLKLTLYVITVWRNESGDLEYSPLGQTISRINDRISRYKTEFQAIRLEQDVTYAVRTITDWVHPYYESENSHTERTEPPPPEEIARCTGYAYGQEVQTEYIDAAQGEGITVQFIKQRVQFLTDCCYFESYGVETREGTIIKGGTTQNRTTVSAGLYDLEPRYTLEYRYVRPFANGQAYLESFNGGYSAIQLGRCQ